MSYIKRKRTPFLQRLAGAQETPEESLRRDNDVMLRTLREIASQGNRRDVSKEYLVSLAKQTLREIR